MNAKDVADLFVDAVGKVEFYWNFYVFTLIAIVGWFISAKKAVPTSLRFLIAVGYLVFALFNVTALMGTYSMAEALRLDLIPLLRGDGVTLPHTVHELERIAYPFQRTCAVYVHCVLGAAMMLIIFRVRRGGETST